MQQTNPVKKERGFFEKTLQIAKPFTSIIPEVKAPLRQLGLQDKLAWTILAVLIYSVASQIPLFGIVNSASKDPISWLRVMMASNRGTLMDLGIGPVLTSSMIMQFLTVTGLVVPDFSIKEDKVLFECLQRMISLLVTIIQAVVQIATGFYGPSENIPMTYKSIIFIQLFISGLIIVLLDEMLQKGYGYGNGVNLFIVSNVCERIFWSAFSPRVFTTGRGIEFEGCLISFVHVIFARRNKLSALYEIFFRENLPNLCQLIYTLSIFAFVVYIQQLKVNLKVYSNKQKGLNELYPIHLLYTSSTPIVVQGQLITHFCALSRFLYSKFPKNIFVRLFGCWEMRLKHGMVPVSGLSYYITSPTSFFDGLKRPFYFVIYLTFTFVTAAIMSKSWLDSHEDTPEKVAERFKNQGIQLKGVRDANTVEKLREYIPVAAILSGLVTSFVIVFCDITSTIGSGTNMFLAASIINQYVKLVVKDSAEISGKAYIE